MDAAPFAQQSLRLGLQFDQNADLSSFAPPRNKFNGFFVGQGWVELPAVP